MRTRLRFAMVALAILTPAVAGAQGGMNLSWEDCGASGTELRFFACDTNSGSSTLYVSAVVPEPMPQMNGVSIVIDVFSSAATLSPWWQMGSGQCRPTALISVFDFTGGPFSCADPWSAQAAGGLSWTSAFGGVPNRARLRGVAAIAGTVPAPEQEMYLFAFRMLHQKTVGTGSCAGCTDKAFFLLNSVLLTQPLGVGDVYISNPLTRATASWRCPGSFDWHGGGVNFFCTTPAKGPSWGLIKSMYR